MLYLCLEKPEGPGLPKNFVPEPLIRVVISYRLVEFKMIFSPYRATSRPPVMFLLVSHEREFTSKNKNSRTN